MTHDAGHWDRRYAAEPGSGGDHLGGAPDPAVVAAVQPLSPGRALDLGTGLGRHARWLAARGWAVTAVDFSGVGIARARALDARADVIDATARQPRRAVASLTTEPAGTPIRWVVADVRTWAPELARTEPELAHSESELGRTEPAPYDLVLAAFVHLDPPHFARITAWLAAGGHLVVVSHAPDADNAPRNPVYRYDEQQLRAAAAGLTIEQITAQNGRVTLVARRP